MKKVICFCDICGKEMLEKDYNESKYFNFEKQDDKGHTKGENGVICECCEQTLKDAIKKNFSKEISF